MGAWGGWALAPYTADGEGLPLPHRLVVASCRTFKTADDFFNPVLAGRWQENPGIAGYLAAFTADFSDAIDGGASFSARLTEALSADGSSGGALSPAGLLPETEASGT